MNIQSSRTKRASELEAKAKELRRAEQAFLREADERKDELLARWGIETNRNSKAHFAVEGGSTGEAVGGGVAPMRLPEGPDTPDATRQVVLGTV